MSGSSRVQHGRVVDEDGAITQRIQDIQVLDGTLNIAGRDVHNTYVYNAGIGSDVPRFPPGWDDIENHRQIHVATLGRATKGTGLWVRQLEGWSIWLDPDGFLKILWGYGMPGAGKTILAAIVINLLEEHAKVSPFPVCICYIYFRYSDHTKTNVRDLLETLVKQTIERHPDCLPVFDEVYTQHNRERTQPSEAELLGLLGRFAAVAPTFYVLDALDEAPSGVQLDIVIQLASVNAKLFITSRPMRTVEAAFPHGWYFPIAAQDHDIDLHISKEVARSADLRALLEQGGASLQAEIFASIKAKCGGMFLHASLQLAALHECTSIHAVQETLAALPVDIDGLYLRTWQRILDQAPAKVHLTQKVLVWVLYATRSLSVEELRYAVATRPDTHDFEAGRLVELHTLIGMCRGLVTIEEETGLVRLVHYTARDVLSRLIKHPFPEPHTFLSAVCMARLGQHNFHRMAFDSSMSPEAGLASALKGQSFLQYAYDSWVQHAQESLKNAAARAQLSHFVASCRSFPVQYNHPSKPAFTIVDLLGSLHLLAFFDLPIALADSDRPPKPNSFTTGDATALHLASLRDSRNAIEGLLRLGHVPVNVTDAHGWTALYLALELGHEDVARLLLAHPEVHINGVDQNGQTALTWAAKRGHEGAVKLVQLLSHSDVDVNIRDQQGQSALSWAAQGGHEGIVKLLLAHPRVAVNVMNNWGQTALSLASVRGRAGIVELLLAYPWIHVRTADLLAARAKAKRYHFLKEYQKVAVLYEVFFLPEAVPSSVIAYQRYHEPK